VRKSCNQPLLKLSFGIGAIIAERVLFLCDSRGVFVFCDIWSRPRRTRQTIVEMAQPPVEVDVMWVEDGAASMNQRKAMTNSQDLCTERKSKSMGKARLRGKMSKERNTSDGRGQVVKMVGERGDLNACPT